MNRTFLQLFHKSVNLGIIALASTTLITLNALAKAEDKPDLEAQIKKQISAYNTNRRQPKLNVNIIYESKGFRLWSEAQTDYNIGQALEKAYAQFEAAIGTVGTIDIVLVDKPIDSMRVDTQKFKKSPLILPIKTIEGKSLSRKSTVDVVVSHEACHYWLISYVDTHGLKNTQHNIGSPSYGHPMLPDWLDEAVAVMCENNESKTARAKLEGFTPIELSKFLSMEHPVYAQIKSMLNAQQKTDNASSSSRVFQAKGAKQEHHNFYSQSLYFQNYLFNKYGDKSIGYLVDDFVHKVPFLQSIDSRFGISGIEELNREFLEYLKTMKL